MRIRVFALLTALLLVPAARARSQTASSSDLPPTRSVDFGAQFSTIDGDDARYQRYQDLRDGALLDGFKYAGHREAWDFDLVANRVGYRDQRYVARLTNLGRVKINFSWDQIPLFFSTGATDAFAPLSATPFTGVGSGQLSLDDSVQQSLQAICPTPPCSPAAGTARQALLFQLVNGQAQFTDNRLRRDTALLDATYTVTPDTDIKFHLQNVQKHGTQPWATPFGFSHTIEIPGPVDHRTTDVGAALEWANDRAMVKVGWDGSWFSNTIPTLTFDNPLRATDFTYASAYTAGDGTSQGRMAMWPDSSVNALSGTATYKLPGRGRVYSSLSLASWRQNQGLVPFTINTAIPTIPLPRNTADADARVTSALVGYSGRPLDKAWFNVRYRLYDFDNNTPEFPVHEYVRLDQVEEEFLTGTGSEAFSYKRQYLDADASYSILPFTAVRVGYSLETDRRTFRQFEHTSENGVKVALDMTGWKYVTLRTQYDYSKRTGSGLEEEVIDADDEGAALPRQFDISDRNRNRFSFVATITPSDIFALNAQIGVFRDERPDSAFGLLKNDGDFFTIGADLTPIDRVAFSIGYGRDTYKSFQRSRQASPGTQEFDPRRDWTTDLEDQVDTVYVSVDLVKAIPKTDVSWNLDWMSGDNTILYGLAANQTIFVSPAALVQLPTANHDSRRSTVDVMYYVRRQLGVGVGWYYDNYDVNDFAWNQSTVNGLSVNPPGQAGGQQVITTRYLYRPYSGNTVSLRLRYFW